MNEPANHNCFAFTSECNGKANRLINEAKVQSRGKEQTYLALWDTGAAITCISKQVATDLQLIPTGYIVIQGSSGSKKEPTYLVDIVLRNNVCVQGVRVSEAEIGSQGIDLLIGMDIIGYSQSRAVKTTCPDFRLLLTFRSGEQRVFDAASLLILPAYRRVRDIFSSAQVEFGTVVWPGDIDISPDTLYLKSVPIETVE